MSDDSQIKLGDYLLTRLAQLGTKTIQGVPGDYNLGFLDLVEDHPDVEWCGNSNELNGAYSADGYARVTKHIAAIVTTFGVGELSAANGIAGALSERVPVVHIVGVPSTEAMRSGKLLHHTLGDGNFSLFESLGSKLSAASLDLAEVGPDRAAKEIDRVLSTCVREALPVYVTLPTDMAHLKISSASLKEKLDTSHPPNNPDAESAVLDSILSRVRAAKDPIILVDACAIRHFVLDETLDLVNKSGLPVFATPMGKTAVDEGHEQYGGVYVGDVSRKEVSDRVDKADLLITIGSLKSDFNTGNFSYRTRRELTIELHSNRILVSHATYANVGMKALLPKLADALAADKEKRLQATRASLPAFENRLPTKEEEGEFGVEDRISQAYFWPRMGRFFRPKDQIVVETGTSSFGMLEAKLEGCMFVSQVLWGSIGWSVGAALGVALGARELQLGRTALFVGDGSLQLSAQEIGTMIRKGLTPIIFVISNDGYEIERKIHGPDRSYNDIARWDHSSLLPLLSGPRTGPFGPWQTSGSQKSHSRDVPVSATRYDAVRTQKELDALLEDPAFADAKACRLVEVFMARDDAPRALQAQAKQTSGSNKYE